MYADEMEEIQKSEWYMDLSIATNPHTDKKDQPKLWNKLKQKQLTKLRLTKTFQVLFFY